MLLILWVSDIRLKANLKRILLMIKLEVILLMLSNNGGKLWEFKILFLLDIALEAI